MYKNTTRLQIEFGKKVRELRLAKGLSQEKFGFETGLDRTYISGIERGKRNPSLINIGKIAQVLKISLQELLQGIEV